MSDGPHLSRMEEIQILLAEYSTLRTELLQRNTTAFQALGVAGTAFVAIITFAFTQTFLGGMVLLVVLPPLIWLVLRLFDFDTRKAASRVRDLETIINDKAGTELLAWEHDYGMLSPGSDQKFIQHLIGPPLRFVQGCRAHVKRLRGSN